MISTSYAMAGAGSASLDLIERAPENELTLPNGQILTLEKFLSDNLFKYTPEKKEIFSKVRAMSESLKPDFETYHLFNKHLRQTFWERTTLSRPIEGALLSILAYFNEDINLEELMIIQTACEAKRIKANKALYDVEKIKIHVIENINQYLMDVNLPPYNSNNMLHVRPDPDLTIIETWGRRSLIEKTVVEYRVQKSAESVDMTIFKTKSGFAYKDITRDAVTFCLLSPLFILRLSHAFSKVNSTLPEQHHIMFGHNPKFGSALYRGVRIISVSSPLVNVSAVHTYTKGPLRLSIQYHDYYHIFIDYNNPYIDLFCKIATNLSPIRTPQPALSEVDKKISTAAARIFVDRETINFKMRSDVTSIFWLQIELMLDGIYVTKLDKTDPCYKQWTDDEFRAWIPKVYFPTLFKTIHEHQRELLYPKEPLQLFLNEGRIRKPAVTLKNVIDSTSREYHFW